MKERAYLVMRLKKVEGKEFPVFDGYHTTSHPSWELTQMSTMFHVTVFPLLGKDYQDAINRFMDMVWDDKHWFSVYRPWFPRNIEEHVAQMELWDKVKAEQTMGL